MYIISLLLLCITNTLGTNILYISSVPSKSHQLWNSVFALKLAHRGHNITFFSPDEHKNKLENYTHILIDRLYDTFNKNIKLSATSTYTSIQTIRELLEMSMVSCNAYLNSEGLQTLLQYPLDFKFNLIIFDITMGSCLYPLIHRFNYPPVIAVTPFLLPPYVANNFGNHLNPSYTPWYNLPYSQEMTFIQRLWNSVLTYAEIALWYFKLYQMEHDAARKVFGEVPPMEQLERHFSLLLTNTDPILHDPQPLAPNVIAVGGLQIQKVEMVPEDLLTIMDNAKNGVIIFSLGTVLRSDSLDENVRKVLLEAFSKIPQIVLWKFESEIEGLPSNVIIRKWLPQSTLLEHHNVKAFIGHGGALSTQEAIYHGVPMICVPFMLDQRLNAHNVVSKKVGILLEVQLITADYVLGKLKEILVNPTYTENVRLISRQFRDRKHTPLDKAVFWTEYVMRKGGTNFSTPARDLYFYSTSGLDFIVFIIVIIYSIFFLSCKVVKCIQEIRNSVIRTHNFQK